MADTRSWTWTPPCCRGEEEAADALVRSQQSQQLLKGTITTFQTSNYFFESFYC